jgi:hypothetical protein
MPEELRQASRDAAMPAPVDIRPPITVTKPTIAQLTSGMLSCGHERAGNWMFEMLSAYAPNAIRNTPPIMSAIIFIIGISQPEWFKENWAQKS